jgi:hypothetical protein
MPARACRTIRPMTSQRPPRKPEQAAPEPHGGRARFCTGPAWQAWIMRAIEADRERRDLAARLDQMAPR